MAHPLPQRFSPLSMIPWIILGLWFGAIPITLAGEAGALRGQATIEASAQAWLDWVQNQVPPLQHERGKRWPLLTWLGPEHLPLTPEQVKMLLARGLTQHIEINAAMIPAAKILAEAGSPVILMEGRGGNWPYSLAGEPKVWGHNYPESMQVPESWRSKPEPSMGIFQGWAMAAEQLRTTLKAFKSSGIKVDGLWLDYEGQPSQAAYRPALLSPQTRAMLPKKALQDEKSFAMYRRQLWLQLLSAYVAAPAREIFPDVSVTNWVATLSTPEHALKGWSDNVHPLSGPTLFTHSAPLAYGVDTFFLTVRDQKKLWDDAQVDRLFTHLLLRQVSEDAFNRNHFAPHVGSLPWVARRVVDHPKKPTPAMRRSTYREVLRHLWLRGIDGMQVFNVGPQGANDPLAKEEILDTQQIYDEMLAYSSFLETGQVMNFKVSDPWKTEVVWSGLQKTDQAVVRLFFQGEGTKTVKIEPWPGQSVELTATSIGKTCIFTRMGEKLPKMDCE